MSKKVFTLVCSIVVALQTIGVALVTFYQPNHATEINSAIVIGCDAVIAICNLFKEPDAQLPAPDNK